VSVHLADVTCDGGRVSVSVSLAGVELMTIPSRRAEGEMVGVLVALNENQARALIALIHCAGGIAEDMRDAEAVRQPRSGL
jgi:hypothetical protein